MRQSDSFEWHFCLQLKQDFITYKIMTQFCISYFLEGNKKRKGLLFCFGFKQALSNFFCVSRVLAYLRSGRSLGDLICSHPPSHSPDCVDHQWPILAYHKNMLSVKKKTLCLFQNIVQKIKLGVDWND